MGKEQEIEKIARFILPIKEGKTWVNRSISLDIAKDIYEAGYRLPEQTNSVALCGGLLIGEDLYEEDGYYFLTETARKRLVWTMKE